MAGAIINGELTATSTRHVRFAVATQADDSELRRLFRETSVPGAISLTLEREPDYFADADLPGEEKQTIVAREDDRVVCAGSCAIRERFVNGRPCRVGYLGGLRLDARLAGRFDVLRRGYEFFRELQAAAHADYYFTSVAADNEPARKFLERGLPGMPAYEFIGEFVTVLLPVGRRSPIRPTPEAGPPDLNELLDCLDKHGRGYQFAACWSAREWTALSALGLRLDHCCVAREHGRVIGCATYWDQRAFKQVVIRGYAHWIACAQPAFNFLARFTRQPRLPALRTTLAHAVISPLAVDPAKQDALIALVARLRSIAAGRGIDFLTLGFATNDPRLARLRGTYRCREYRSRIYVVRWPGLGGMARDLDGRCLGPEVALL